MGIKSRDSRGSMGTADSETGQIIELCLSKQRNQDFWEKQRCHRLWEAEEGQKLPCDEGGVSQATADNGITHHLSFQTKCWRIGEEKPLSTFAVYDHRQV